MGIKDIFVGSEPAAAPEQSGLQGFESYTPEQVARAIGATSVGSSTEATGSSLTDDRPDLDAKMDELWRR